MRRNAIINKNKVINLLKRIDTLIYEFGDKIL
jgi:hypothetical protein